MKYSANYIYSPKGFLENHVLETDETGVLRALRPLQEEDNPIFLEGILSPGFVNAHCHLELSALKGLVPEHTGMTGFAANIVSKRKNILSEKNQAAIESALHEMWQSGTQAVGDICNESTTAAPKKAFNRLFCYNFIEVFGMRESIADSIWEQALQTCSLFVGKNQQTNLTLHAPYSISASLLEKVKTYFLQKNDKVVSIHLLESKAERAIFEEKTGDFVDLYRNIGIDFEGFPTQSPIEYVLSPFQKKQALILVHNTEITEAEIQWIISHFPNAFFCLCPRSNLFIHNTFPDINLFLKFTNRVCLGTDSLASNHSLEMLAEINAIQKNFPDVSFHTLLTWLITNGAAALQKNEDLGHFEIGKNTGLIHIQGIEGMKLSNKTKAIRLY